MWSAISKNFIRDGDNAYSIIRETKRFAGHSKWANIKHIKAEKDKERGMLFSKYFRLMKVAITGMYCTIGKLNSFNLFFLLDLQINSVPFLSDLKV